MLTCMRSKRNENISFQFFKENFDLFCSTCGGREENKLVYLIHPLNDKSIYWRKMLSNGT